MPGAATVPAFFFFELFGFLEASSSSSSPSASPSSSGSGEGDADARFPAPGGATTDEARGGAVDGAGELEADP